MKISDRVILPLVGSAFQPGKAAEAIEKIEDKELAQIAQGEYYFFSAQAEKCVETVKDYLDHDDVMLRLSADMLYTFANLTLGNPQAAQCTREDVQQCLTRAMQMDAPVNVKAACLFAFYVISIFLHIPPEEGTPPLQQYIPYLPIGQRLFAVSLLAHEIYLRQDYAKAKGVVQGAFLMADGVYPIAMIYLGCVQAMCQINLKEQEEAIQTVSQAWEWARFDKFMEPFIEYHGLLHGVLEVCIRKKEPEIPKNQYTKWFDYDKIKGTLSVRTRRRGDYLILPSGGSKTIARYMIDEKIPKEKREQILLLAEGSHVLWVVGFRISEYYKIEEHTENILQVTCDGGKDYGR